MGYDIDSMMARLTAPYDSNVAEPSFLPATADLDVSPALTEGAANQTAAVTFTLTAFEGLTVVITPGATTTTIDWTSGTGETRSAVLDMATEYTVTEVRLDRVVLTFDNGVVLRAYSVGLVTFQNLDSDLMFATAVADFASVDAGYDGLALQELNSDDWWVASTDNISSASDVLTTGLAATTSVFYSSQGHENVLAFMTTLSPDQNLPGASDEGYISPEQIARCLIGGFWAQHERDLSIAETQSIYSQRTGAILSQSAKDWGVPRRAGESDASLLIRWKGKIIRVLGSVNPDAIQESVAAFFGSSASDIMLSENATFDDPDTYIPAFLEVRFSTDLLSSLGFTAPFTQQITDIEDILQEAVGAGILVQVNLLTGALYDTAVYDTDVYGS